MSDGAGTEKSSRAVEPSRQRRAATSSPPGREVKTIGGGATVLVASADEVRATFLQAARHQRAQEALLELLTQRDLKERRLSWEMLAKLGVDVRKDTGGGGAPTQILIQNHLPIPAKPPASAP